jgi:hypothetical protein
LTACIGRKLATSEATKDLQAVTVEDFTESGRVCAACHGDLPLRLANGTRVELVVW